MNIELKTIDPCNWDDVERLKVSDQQKQYIASNKDSLITSRAIAYKEIARPFAIYAQGRIVGFAMFAFDLASQDPEDRYWLWRFMIDKHMQGNGYGSAALEKIIEYFQNQGANHLMLSTKPSNTAALSLYRKFQFAETGERNEDEIVLRRNL